MGGNRADVTDRTPLGEVDIGAVLADAIDSVVTELCGNNAAANDDRAPP